MSNSLQRLKRIFNVRNAMRLLFVVIALVTVWAIFCVEERWRGERQWNNYRKEALQKGAKLEMKDVIPADIPDSENFAAIPIIQKLFAPQEEGQPPKWFIAVKLGDINPPPGFRLRKQPLLDSYRDEFVKRGILHAPATDSAEAVLTALNLVEPELQELREAGKRPKAKFPVPWERGIAALMPHLGPLQSTSQLYQLGIAANLAKGDTGGAFQYVQDGFRIHTALRTEPAMVSGLVRMAILQGIEKSIVEDGALSKWSEQELQQIASDLAKEDLSADFEFVVESERALMNTVFSDLMSKSNFELASLGKIIGMPEVRASVSLYPRGWFRLSQVKSNQHFDRMIARGLHVATKVPEDQLLRLGTGSLKRLPYILYLWLTPAVEEFPRRYAYASSFHQQVQLACALTRFQRKNNIYPETLAALVPDFLASVPRDPVDGSPMRYRRTGDAGFILWSIGLDGIDEGGKSDSAKPGNWNLQPDWVLQVPGKP
jgi:hypothetical protein